MAGRGRPAPLDELADNGWTLLPATQASRAWANAALAASQGVLNDPTQQEQWLRHGKTWFVGVDALTNDNTGALGDVPLSGPWDAHLSLPRPLHRAQVSAVYPGYPRRDPEESEAAHRFRRDMAAAHLDGLLAEGEGKRRHLREPHRIILGIALTPTEASPLVVWEGSHDIIRAAFMAAFAGTPPDRWGDVDVTDIYKDAREEVFETCDAVAVNMSPGEAVLVHRLAIHGVAPWDENVSAPNGGARIVAYFRPVFEDMRDWLRQP